MRHVRAVLACLCVVACGCGGGGTDPFERVQLSGTVTLDGKPIQWGTLNVKGAKNEETQEQALESYAIRDGQIMADPGARGTTQGMNELNVLIFASDPTDENKQAQVTGTWTAQQTIAADQPLNINIESSALQKPERSID